MPKKNVLINSRLRKVDELIRQNKLAEAIVLCEKLCQLSGGNPEYWMKLSILARNTGDNKGAEESSRKAVRLSPSSPLANYLLGVAIHSQGRPDEAVCCYLSAIKFRPDFVEAHYYLANAYRETGKLDDAIEAYKRLLKIDPDHIEGLNNYGALLTNLERSEEAAKVLSRALEINGDSVETLANLARAYIIYGDPERAIDLLMKALRIRPGFLDAYLELAKAYRLNGKYEAALKYLDKVIETVPDNRRAWLGKAAIYEILGKHDQAFEIIEHLRKDGATTDVLSVLFDVSAHVGGRSEVVVEIEDCLKRDDINIAATGALHFRLGDYYDREGSYEKAFFHYSAANGLSRRNYIINNTAEKFGAIIETYNIDYVSTMPCASNVSDLMVFIIGMPRSGTSLAEQIVASHPLVFGAGETNKIDSVAKELAERYSVEAFPGFVAKMTENSLEEKSSDLIAGYSSLSPFAKRITDKMPHNFMYVGLMLQLFPACKIIHCKRNPLDTCLSCYVSSFGTHYHNYTYDLAALGEYYIQYTKLMDHWNRVFPGRIVETSYEALVEDQEGVSRTLIDYCGLEWDEACMHFHKQERLVNTISYNQVRQPLYNRSINRWEHYKHHLDPLRNALNQAGIGC